MAQVRAESAVDGVITIIGMRAGRSGNMRMGTPVYLPIRRIMVGNIFELEDVVRAIRANSIKPVINSQAFKFVEVTRPINIWTMGIASARSQ
jgi:hypothetical protein